MLTEGRDYYINEQGLLVFTERYHQSRGYCCGRGCLHCPFDYKAVPEPKRTELLQKKNTEQKLD